MRPAADRQATPSARMTSTSLVALAVVATCASIVVSDPQQVTWSTSAELAQELLLPTTMACAVILISAERIHPTASNAWLAAAMTLVGIQGLPMLATTSSESSYFDEGTLSTAIAVGLTLLLVLKLANGRYVRIPPMPLGIGIGLLLVAARGLRHYLSVPEVQSGRAVIVGCALLLAVGGTLAISIRRVSALPLGSNRLALAAVLWAGAATVRALGLAEAPIGAIVAIVGALLASTLTMATALDLLWLAMREEQADTHRLHQQLARLRDTAREGVEQLHEVKGTIAGIASATDLIRHEHRLSSQHRERLEEMLARETARLQRLVHADADHTSRRPVDLDDVIAPIVTAHRVQGQPVIWTAPEFPVMADADELAEVVNILLQNAAVHASGAPVRIFTRELEGDLQLVVADSGPGVPPDLHERIFEWGYRRSASEGQGVGLASARRLLAKCGCYLRLDPDHVQGAAFLIELKRTDRATWRGADSVLTR